MPSISSCQSLTLGTTVISCDLSEHIGPFTNNELSHFSYSGPSTSNENPALQSHVVAYRNISICDDIVQNCRTSMILHIPGCLKVGHKQKNIKTILALLTVHVLDIELNDQQPAKPKHSKSVLILPYKLRAIFGELMWHTCMCRGWTSYISAHWCTWEGLLLLFYFHSCPLGLCAGYTTCSSRAPFTLDFCWAPNLSCLSLVCLQHYGGVHCLWSLFIKQSLHL